MLRKVPLLGIVALRKESVDRNFDICNSTATLPVALRKESVDRNLSTLPRKAVTTRRSPQGERG